MIEIYSRKVFPNADIAEYRMKTLNPKFKGVVFNYENQVLYHNQLNYKNFTFIICKEHFIKPAFVFYYRKNHFLVDNTNIYLERMIENGLIDMISSKYADKRFTGIRPDTGPKVLQINQLYGAIEIYCFCNLLSIVVFFVEIIFKGLKRRFS